MAKQDEAYENALASIFDFIFKQAKSKSKPLRPPPRPSGATGNELADGLAEIAAKPALYATDALMQFLNQGLLDQKLIELYVDQLDSDEFQNIEGSSGRFRIKANDLSKFIANPGSFVSGAVDSARGERAWARVAGFGKFIDQAAARLWARKNGFSRIEADRFAKAAKMTVTPEMMADAKSMALENAATDAAFGMGLSANRAKAMGESFNNAMNTGDLRRVQVFGNGVQNGLFTGSEDEFWTHALRLDAGDKKIFAMNRSQVAPGDLEKYLALQDAKQKLTPNLKLMQRKSDNLRNELRKSMSDGEINALFSRFHAIGLHTKGHYLSSRGTVNQFAYRDLLFNKVGLEALMTSDKAERELAAMKQKALMMWQRAKGPGNFNVRGFKELNDRIQQNINDFAGDPVAIKELEALQKKIKGFEQSEVDRLRRVQPIKLGGFERSADTKNVREALKLEIESDSLLESRRLDRVMDQLRAESRKASPDASRIADLNRQRERYQFKLSMLGYKHDKFGSVPGSTLRISLGNAVQAYRSISSTVLKGGPTGLGLGLVTGVFYFGDPYVSPGTIGGKEIYSSDGKSKYGATLVTPKSDIAPYYSMLTNLYYLTPGSLLKTFFWNGEAFSYITYRRQEYLRALFKSPEGVRLLNSIGYKGSFDKLMKNFPDIMKKLGGVQDPNLKGLARIALRNGRLFSGFSGIAGFYSRLSAPAGQAAKVISDAIQNGIAKGLLRLVPINHEIWQIAVKKFSAGQLGLRQLIEAGITALLKLGSISLPGIGPAITGAAWALTGVVTSLAKPLLGLFVFAFMGFVFLLCAGAFSIGNFFMPQQHLIPSVGGVEFDPGLLVDRPPPIDSTCPIDQESPVRCTQGPQGRFSHAGAGFQPGIDIVPTNPFFFAPSDGTIILSKAVNNICGDGSNIGGQVEFRDNEGNIYVIRHGIPLFSVGASIPAGTAISQVQRSIPGVGNCWTGAHFDINVKSGGRFVDAEEWFEALDCNIGVCPI